MSSESNGRKPEPNDPVPSSGAATRQSVRAPSASGAMRDALAALHNLDALLRSDSVLYRTILDLVPELRTSTAPLRAAFERARAGEGASVEVGDYGVDRVAALERLLDATATADDERDDLARRARSLAGELEATADLLALLERAEDPAVTDVDVPLVLREAARRSASGRGAERTVRLQALPSACAVAADPRVVGPLFALLVARVSAVGAREVVARVHCHEAVCAVTVEPAGAAEAALEELTMRVLPAVPPAASVAREAAARSGATLELSPVRAVLRLPRPPG